MELVVYTRSNPKGDADIADNEARRARGTAYLDFFGYDPYTTSIDYVFNYGQDSHWAQGRNFPMIMENHAGCSNADILKFNAAAGNVAYNTYAAVDPDAASGRGDKALYDFNPTTKVVTRKAVSPKVAAMNYMLDKIAGTWRQAPRQAPRHQAADVQPHRRRQQQHHQDTRRPERELRDL